MPRQREKPEASSRRSSSKVLRALPVSPSQVSSSRSSSTIPRALPVSSSQASSSHSSSTIPRALPSSSQGKRKMDSDPIPESSCGICLVGPIRSILGRIDGCDHQFCFVCIMEWAKVDSRCPLCRGRFGSVCRSAMPGLFSSDRIVTVPRRDQVHNPYVGENVTMSEPNPNTNCTICNSNKDKVFLKLCNLCNTNSHTYCTGHGYTVPDAKWYCPDCEICRVDRLRYKPEEQETLERIKALRNGESTMNMDDFVGMNGTNELVRPIGLVPSSINFSSNQRVDDRVNSIRANWGLIRTGDVEFQPGFVNPRNKDKIEDERKKGRKREAKKAWRMLDKAKTHCR